MVFRIVAGLILSFIVLPAWAQEKGEDSQPAWNWDQSQPAESDRDKPRPTGSDWGQQPPPSSDWDQPAQRSDQCSTVTCSRHGNCVVLNGSPTCACFQGYTVDSINGLNCIPVSSAQADSTARVSNNPREIPAPGTKASLTAVLEGYDLTSYHGSWLRDKAKKKYVGSFTDYVQMRLKKSKNTGMIMMFLGVAFFCGAAAFHSVGGNSELLAPALIADVAGLCFFIAGMATFVVNRKRLKLLKNYQTISFLSRRMESV